VTALQIPFLIALALGLDATTSPYYFGQHPLGDVHVAVDYYAPKAGNEKCSIPPNAFFAYMLAPTWWEVAGESRSNTPSPMTLSRGDDGPTLYAPGGAQYRRAFWHTGIGMWQLDDRGDGTDLSVEKFNSISSSFQIALKMAGRYCNDSSYYSIWAPFCACGSDGTCAPHNRDRCIPTATNIINGTPIQEDTSTESSGGIEMRTCSLPGQAQVFQCFYVKPTVPPAQGYTGSPSGTPYGWISYPDATTLPLAKPFYVYKQWPDGSDGHSYEWRYWMAEDTGFGQDFAARRQYGTWSKDKLCWISTSGSTPASCNLPPSSLGLCDVTASRGACGGSCRAAVGQVGQSCTSCHSLTLARNDSSGGGLPTASPSNSSGCGAGQYVSGANIQVSAHPASGFGVGSWAGTGNDASTSTTNSLVMPAFNQTVKVNYVQISQNGRPTVTTGVSDQTTATSTNLHGWVNPNGLSTNVYIAYGTDVVHSPSYTGQQNIGLGGTTVPFSAFAANLACSTAYGYYAIGSNSAGTGTGQIETFTTGSCPTSSAPTITSEWADGITQTSAVLHGSVNPNGLSTTANFQYGTNPSSQSTTPHQSIGSSTSAATIAWSVSSLNCGTTYSYNAVGTNSAGTSSGLLQTFTTLACTVSNAPIVSNESVSSITAGSAFLHAQVDPRGFRTDTSFQYGTNPSGALETTPPLPISGLAQFDEYIFGLSCATTYGFNMVASGSGGTTLGPWLTFNTGACGPSALPGVKDESVDGIGQISATFHVSVNPNGATTGVFFQYGLDTFSLTSTPSQILNPSTSWQSVGEALPGGSLICGTTYYYQAVVYNASNGQGVYLPLETFNTLPCGQPGTAGWPISLITGQADSITQTSAVLHGSANPNGASTTAFFVLYPRPFPSPRFTSGSVNLGSSNTDQPFAITVTGLSCATTYDYLADAINIWGESNDRSYQFTTLSCSGINTILNDGFESGDLIIWQVSPP
jgi:hypothetical protein